MTQVSDVSAVRPAGAMSLRNLKLQQFHWKSIAPIYPGRAWPAIPNAFRRNSSRHSGRLQEIRERARGGWSAKAGVHHGQRAGIGIAQCLQYLHLGTGGADHRAGDHAVLSSGLTDAHCEDDACCHRRLSQIAHDCRPEVTDEGSPYPGARSTSIRPGITRTAQPWNASTMNFTRGGRRTC